MDARAVRRKAAAADAAAGGALRSVGFSVAPSGKTGRALVAETTLQRARGLRGNDLGAHDAMMFSWPADHATPLTMQGVSQDLDVAWLDETGGFLGSTTMRKGQPAIPPPGPYRHAVEFLSGGLQKFGVTDGSRMTFEDDGTAEPIDIPHIDPGSAWGEPS